MPRVKHPGISRLLIKNYKSIGQADLQLGKVNLLVGLNGSGKSNALDALHFVSDCLRSNVDHALRMRGGIKEVRRKSNGHPNSFQILIEAQLPMTNRTVSYSFKIGSAREGGFRLLEEKFLIRKSSKQPEVRFQTKNGELVVDSTSFEHPPAVPDDRLYLSMMSGFEEVFPVYQAFESMGFYNLNPKVMKELQPADSGDVLHEDGSNIASVLARMPEVRRERISQYLRGIVPGIQSVKPREIADKETLEFSQEVAGARHPWKFYAHSMSDGTLRALGVLVAIFHGESGRKQIPLIGIEEPESALHPAAGQLLFEAIQEASLSKQILVTTHSPDLLDSEELKADSIKAVVLEDGNTKIAPIDNVGREAMRKNLMTAGDLLRADHLRPDPEAVLKAEQLDWEKELRASGL